MPALLLCALALALALLAPPQAGAAEKPAAAPDLDAAAWILIDPRDGTELAAHHPHEQRSIASTTKLMTAYLGLKSLGLRDELTVPRYSPGPAESVVGLRQGEKLTVEDLLLAMMLPSANDAAETMAVGVAGSEDAFVTRMNEAARKLGLDDTSYSNPIGLDDVGNYSSAADLAKLATILLKDERFRKIVSTPEADLRSGSMPRHVETRNTLMLSDPSVDGVKTGYTIDAGNVLVASAKRQGVRLISAVLGAPSESERDGESERLLDYGYSLYSKRAAFARGDELTSARVAYSDEPLSLVAGRELSASVRSDEKLETEVDAPDSVEGPIEQGQLLGHATVTLDGSSLGRVPLLAATQVAAPSWLDRHGGTVVGIAIALALIVILLLVALMIRRRNGGQSDRGRSAEERMRSHQERSRRRGKGGEGQ